MKDKIKAGMALLDEQAPLLPDYLTNWRDRIDILALDMGDGGWCVLGQLFDDYLDGMLLLGLYKEDGSEDFYTVFASGDPYGFSIDPFKIDDNIVEYNILTAEWKEALS